MKLFEKFIKDSKSGKRLKKGSKKVSATTISNYNRVYIKLCQFSERKGFYIRIQSLSHVKGVREFKHEKQYWKDFYTRFTSYIYDDCGGFDNYVGFNIKAIRAFFNYLNEELELNIGIFHKKFDVPHENTEIIVLLQSQLKFLIRDKEFDDSLNKKLKETKDLFVFGCTVALRVSDLMKLTPANIECVGSKYYLRVASQKTNTFTRVLLPPYAVDILNRNMHKRKTIFKYTWLPCLNQNIKSIMSLAGWNEERIVTRQRRGETIVLYKNDKTKTPYRFSDLVSSHTMRKTAITTLLCLKVPEAVVRKISGHAPNSKEFYRYVELSQKYQDEEIEKAYEQL